jgi:cbb3-type cytochrome oxidase maturation protein
MSALFILIGISLIIAMGFLVAFLLSVKNGQFDDDYTPSVRILFEDNDLPKKENKSKNK